MSIPAVPAPQPAALGLTKVDKPYGYWSWYPPAAPVYLRSVTTLLGVVDKPALQGWYANTAAAAAVDNVELTLRNLEAVGRDATVKLIAGAGRAERDRKAQIGTDAHKAIEEYLLGLAPQLTDDTAPLFDHFVTFMRQWRFRPIWSEAMVASERHGYAGTFDLYGMLAGKRCLIDVKTGGYIDAAMGLQLAAYANADFIGRPGTTDRWKVPDVDLFLILHLQPTFYRLLPYSVGPAEFQAFLAAQAIDRWQRVEGKKVMGQPLTEGMLRIA